MATAIIVMLHVGGGWLIHNGAIKSFYTIFLVRKSRPKLT